MKLILASGSPRRKEILEKYGYDFRIEKSFFIEEKSGGGEKIAKLNAEGKAKDVFSRLNEKDAVVLGADTVVVLGGEILGKPKDKKDAVNMLKKLSGKTHEVITGYSIVTNRKVVTDKSVSRVCFNYLSDEIINKYVESGLPLDKAGAYGIQDGYSLVDKFVGSLNNIIGLPIEEIATILNEINDIE